MQLELNISFLHRTEYDIHFVATSVEAQRERWKLEVKVRLEIHLQRNKMYRISSWDFCITFLFSLLSRYRSDSTTSLWRARSLKHTFNHDWNLNIFRLLSFTPHSKLSSSIFLLLHTVSLCVSYNFCYNTQLQAESICSLALHRNVKIFIFIVVICSIKY